MIVIIAPAMSPIASSGNLRCVRRATRLRRAGGRMAIQLALPFPGLTFGSPPGQADMTSSAALSAVGIQSSST
jgi:hypothetical protein